MQKEFKVRMQQKHDTEANWKLASDFVPLAGEFIIYEADKNYPHQRFKIGNGVTPLNELPFQLSESAGNVEPLTEAFSRLTFKKPQYSTTEYTNVQATTFESINIEGYENISVGDFLITAANTIYKLIEVDETFCLGELVGMWVDSGIDNIGAVIDYDSLINKPIIPTKTSQLTNDSGYLTRIPAEYVTEAELNNKGYLTEHQNISGKADRTDLTNHTKNTDIHITAEERIAWSNGSTSNGKDGFSPIATVTQTSTGATISIQDKNGTTTATIKNGKTAYESAKDGGYTGTEAQFNLKLAEADGTQTATASPSVATTKCNSIISVAEIVDVAWSYYNVRGTEETPRFEYKQSHTPLDGDFDPNSTEYSGAIDCSSYIGLILRGIPYEKSPYANTTTTEFTNLVANTIDYNWAIDPFDWSNKVDDEKGILPVRRASQLAQWMAERGQAVPLDATFSNVQRGDVIFWAKKDDNGNWVQPNRYKHISHVAICVNVVEEETNGYPKKHTMLEVTTIKPYVLNRTLEKTYPDDVIMVCRPDLGALSSDEFVGNVASTLGITNISRLYRAGTYYLTSDITEGLPEGVTSGSYHNLKVEKTLTEKGKPRSITQILTNTKTNVEYRRTQYCDNYTPREDGWTTWKSDMISDGNGVAY